VQADVDTTLALLQQRLPELPPPAAAAAHALLARREALQAQAAQLAGPVQALKTRYHGDYHLGQVLVTKNDFVIIDFEGEPARPLEERRAKRSPLRDVAGMLRSFDYAATCALREAATTDAERESLAAPAARWQQQARAAFLAGYEAAAEGRGLYAGALGTSPLLALYEMEKALYELRYELNNRPGWVQIPLQGLQGLLGRGAAPGARGAE
jgi:maltose alpha-D-glucosyltransferase/alpha-amylase